MSERVRERDVLVLGAGPAGLAAALALAERGFSVEVLERQATVGGAAGSFEIAGQRVDFGSHRLHPAADPAVLARIRELLGEDLLERPRHGRIRLLGRWIHFPLRPLDLALRMHPRFAVGVLSDLALGLLKPKRDRSRETFATVLEEGLGRTICRHFYFPFGRKIWGLEPEEISPEQAYRRVSAGSMGKLLRRLLPFGGGRGGSVPKGTFYYPRLGYGQISDRLCEAARGAGARISTRATARRITPVGKDGFRVEIDREGGVEEIPARRVWSTIPMPVLARLIDPAAPPDLLAAADSLELRSMVLIYLVLGQGRFTEFDAHYFPQEDIPITRLSEPKNYAALDQPKDRTVLCAELPCSRQDPFWTMSAEDLAEVVTEALARVGLSPTSAVLESQVRRLPHAYPIYRRGYEESFERVRLWLGEIDGLLSFGRQGLFAHDNTHHTVFMAQAAVDCMEDDGSFDLGKWQRYGEVFATHVVED